MRRLPSPAMVVAVLALIIAIGGTTYAAVTLKRNSVGAKHLKRNAVTRPKLANDAVDAAEIKALAVRSAEIATAAVDGAKIQNLAVGTPKIQSGAVDSSRIADQALLRADAAPGTLVTAYARINNPPGADNATIAPGSAVNVPDIDVISEADGNFIVTFNGLPGNSLATCTLIGQPVLTPSSLGSLLKMTTMIATGGGSLSASSAQVQTLDPAGNPDASDFYIQVSCPPA